MRAQEGTFRGLMTQDRQFRVPLYQRHYRWRTDQQRDLWQDILEQYRAVANPDSDVPRHSSAAWWLSRPSPTHCMISATFGSWTASSALPPLGVSI
jgi:hypothetical protein